METATGMIKIEINKKQRKHSYIPKCSLLGGSGIGVKFTVKTTKYRIVWEKKIDNFVQTIDDSLKLEYCFPYNKKRAQK